VTAIRHDQAFTINVTHVNHAPLIGTDTIATGSIASDQFDGSMTVDAVSGTITFNDVDQGDAHTVTSTASAPVA